MNNEQFVVKSDSSISQQDLAGKDSEREVQADSSSARKYIKKKIYRLASTFVVSAD